MSHYLTLDDLTEYERHFVNGDVMAAQPKPKVSEDRVFGEDYHEKFIPEAFLKSKYSRLSGRHVFPLRNLHEIFKSYGPTSAGLKVLDYGAGPVVMYMISAPLQASEVVLAEYTASCRDAIKDWIAKDPKAFDWTPFFKFVVEGLEGSGDKEVVERQDQLRGIIKGVVYGDIWADPPIEKGFEGPYDFINTGLCLEAACQTYEAYKEGLCRLTTLLKPGGRITMFSVETGKKAGTEAYYCVGTEKFLDVGATAEFLQEALEEAGYEEIVVKRFSREEHKQMKTGFEEGWPPPDSLLFATGVKKTA